jgi:lysophospholipase L1-like esterase
MKSRVNYNLTIPLIAFFLMFQVGAFPNTLDTVTTKKQYREMEMRNGLPNFFEKTQKSDTIKVAYLGGSITAQKGWRVYSLKWFQERFPEANFKEINAAIGGTGSKFGVYRLNDQVLAFNPDLVFVEFAVNDDASGNGKEKIIRSMEGIVRNIWQHNPKTDICFVYTLTESFLETEMNAQLPTSAIIMEKVAEKYGIPSINFGFEVCNKIKDKQLILKGKSRKLNGIQVFSPDGTHPYPETGHLIYQEVLERSFKILQESIHNEIYSHLLPLPLTTDFVSKAKMIDIQQTKLSKDWEILKNVDNDSFVTFKTFLPVIAKTNKSSSAINFKFKGKSVGIFDIIGPDAGRVIVTIDGIIQDTVFRFDPWCSYYRMSYFVLDELKDTIHDVSFRFLSDPFDKISILKQTGATMKNPDDYKNNVWYVGKILIDGDLIK